MFFDELFRSFVPLHNPISFGPLDFIELTVAALLAGLAISWRPWIAPAAARFARRTKVHGVLAALPIALRLALLPHHPVPTPDIYDEFGHLLVADTLRHWRLANPPHPLHRFFETSSSCSSQPTVRYTHRQRSCSGGRMGRLGTPWAGVLLCTGAFCALCYWMLRGWITPGWALLGGMLAVFEFGPLNQWTNSYWGGAFAASAGCLVFGSLPRLRNTGHLRYGALAGLGLGMHLLSRPYESIFLILGSLLFFGRDLRRTALLRPWYRGTGDFTGDRRYVAAGQTRHGAMDDAALRAQPVSIWRTGIAHFRATPDAALGADATAGTRLPNAAGVPSRRRHRQQLPRSSRLSYQILSVLFLPAAVSGPHNFPDYHSNLSLGMGSAHLHSFQPGDKFLSRFSVSLSGRSRLPLRSDERQGFAATLAPSERSGSRPRYHLALRCPVRFLVWTTPSRHRGFCGRGETFRYVGLD